MTENRTITMSKEEIKRSEILRMAEERRITQKEGARRVGISERHFRRLLAQYREGAIIGVTHADHLRYIKARYNCKLFWK